MKNNVNIEFINDPKVCNELFNEVPNHLKPAWLSLILSYFNYYLQEVPTVVSELIQIIDDENSWYKAKAQTNKIAKYRQQVKDYSIENYLQFAEKVAYITDEIFHDKNNFDEKSSIEIVRLANEAGQNCTENHFIIYDLESGFTIFKYEKELKILIQTTDDFRIFRKIDDIIWHDWDPLDLNSRWFRFEYLGYIPELFNLMKNNTSTTQIAQYLKNLESKYFDLHSKSLIELEKIAEKMKG